MKFSVILGAAALGLCTTASAQVVTKVNTLNPFTNSTQISFDYDKSTLRLTSIKIKQFATKETETYDTGYCNSLTEPGGSMYCPEVSYGDKAPGYEVDMTYVAPDSNNEYSTTSTFSAYVVLSPQDLSEAFKKEAASNEHLSHAEADKLFSVNVDTAKVLKDVVDESKSKYCDGNYVDGNWVQYDPNCRDVVVTKKAYVNPDYATVTITPKF